MEPVTLKLFGSFSLEVSSRRILLGDKEAALVAFLALERDGFATRSRVAGALWPDRLESRARANLSTSIWRARAVARKVGLADDLVLSDADHVWLNTRRLWIDVENFKKGTVFCPSYVMDLDLLGHAVACLDLYIGDLLEDWDFEWCVLERESLRERYLRTAEMVIESFERRGRWDIALRYARRAVGVDPYREQLQRALVRLLIRSGDRAAALAQISRFAALVKREFGVELDEATLSLRRAIRQSYLVSQGAADEQVLDQPLVPSSRPMIGRISERRDLMAGLERAKSGIGAGFFVVGETGVGKSRLLEWFAEEWAASGGSVKKGRCVEFGQPVPYHPVVEVLKVQKSDVNEARATGSSTSAPVHPWVAGGDSECTEGQNFFAWTLFRIEALAARKPLLLIIEDVQWADATTADLIAYLLERARSLPVVVAISATLPSTSRQIAMHVRMSRCADIVLRLAPLTKTETVELVQSLAGSTSTAISELVWTESEGNPLFAIETFKMVRGRHSIYESNLDTYEAPPQLDRLSVKMPDVVRSALGQRLSGLPPWVVEIASAASVLGRSFDCPVLAALTRTQMHLLLSAIELLTSAGVFERDGAVLRFSHDKYRALCYERLSPDERRSFHRKAYGILSRRGDVAAGVLAWHQFAARRWSQAARWWETAGDHAASAYAYEEAAQAYRLAADCRRRAGSSRGILDRARSEFQVLAKFDRVLAVLGRTKERRQILRRMWTLSTRDWSNELLSSWYLHASSLEEHIGNFDLAARLARRSWRIAGALGLREIQLAALRSFAWALGRGGHNWRALSAFKLCLRKMKTVESRDLITAFWQTAVVCVKLSDYALASVCLEQAKLATRARGFLGESAEILGVEAIADKWMGRPEAARAKLCISLQIAKEAHDRVMIARLNFHLATVDCLEGRLGQALSRLRRATVGSREIEYVRTHLSCLNEVVSGLGRIMGNFEWAHMASTHAVRLAGLTRSRFLYAVCKDAEAQLLIEEGRFAEAAVMIDEVFSTLEAEGYPVGQLSEAIMRRGVVNLCLGRPSVALADLEAAARLQSQAGDRLVLVNCLTYLAMAYAEIGSVASAYDASVEAIRLLESINYANHQPQRVYWHHYCILQRMNRGPRIQYLQRAVELIEVRAATLSRAQQRRLKTAVPLNREILAAWEQLQHEGANGPTSEGQSSANGQWTAPPTTHQVECRPVRS